ncbi:MAG: flagellar basal body-associated protein FliL [bacterium]
MFESDERGFALSKKLLFILIPVFLILVGAGIFGYLRFAPKDDAKANEKEIAKKKEKEKDEEKIYPIIPMSPFVVNLAGEAGSRYLKIDIQLEIDNPKTEEEIALRNPVIRDSILILLSSQKFSDINDAKGKILLRKEITQRINGILKKGKVLQTYFSEFVVQ